MDRPCGSQWGRHECENGNGDRCLLSSLSHHCGVGPATATLLPLHDSADSSHVQQKFEPRLQHFSFSPPSRTHQFHHLVIMAAHGRNQPVDLSAPYVVRSPVPSSTDVPERRKTRLPTPPQSPRAPSSPASPASPKVGSSPVQNQSDSTRGHRRGPPQRRPCPEPGHGCLDAEQAQRARRPLVRLHREPAPGRPPPHRRPQGRPEGAQQARGPVPGGGARAREEVLQEVHPAVRAESRHHQRRHRAQRGRGRGRRVGPDRGCRARRGRGEARARRSRQGHPRVLAVVDEEQRVAAGHHHGQRRAGPAPPRRHPHGVPRQAGLPAHLPVLRERLLHEQAADQDVLLPRGERLRRRLHLRPRRGRQDRVEGRQRPDGAHRVQEAAQQE